MDVARLRRVLDHVAKNANWDQRRKNKKSLGLAAHRVFNCYSAAAKKIKKDSQGKIQVDEIWITLDAGFVVNPERVKAQMEGSAIFGLTVALFGDITMKDGITQQWNFDSYPVARIGDVPRKIHVEIISSENLPPGGVGEPGVPPVAPAITNAIFALTGKRIRELPVKI